MVYTELDSELNKMDVGKLYSASRFCKYLVWSGFSSEMKKI